ncbi:MAG: hypothetical protein CVV03_09265 [Firmicutes bacterium HGW-Firmicutes-8]|nr:MAG: hypothetical protein CVV03_09265 [Firmicutes bacterium HGW-Firmicutes-8]
METKESLMRTAIPSDIGAFANKPVGFALRTTPAPRAKSERGYLFKTAHLWGNPWPSGTHLPLLWHILGVEDGICVIVGEVFKKISYIWEKLTEVFVQ